MDAFPSATCGSLPFLKNCLLVILDRRGRQAGILLHVCIQCGECIGNESGPGCAARGVRVAGHAAAAPSTAGGQWPATHAGMRRAEEGPRRGVRPLVLRGAPQGGGERQWAGGLLGLPLCGLLGLHCAALSGRLLRRVSGRLRCREMLADRIASCCWSAWLGCC